MAVTSSLLHKDKENPVLNTFSIFLIDHTACKMVQLKFEFLFHGIHSKTCTFSQNAGFNQFETRTSSFSVEAEKGGSVKNVLVSLGDANERQRPRSRFGQVLRARSCRLLVLQSHAGTALSAAR